MTSHSDRATVAVIGGGLAGLSAAAAAVEHGCRVELFEQAAHLGGRAASFRDLPSGQLVDTCQHVALGCCTNLLDFCRRLGVADCLDCCRTLHFFAPDGVRSDLAAVAWLPAPLHLLPGLLRQRHLAAGERWQALGALARLARPRPRQDRPEETIGQWLRRQRQSPRIIARFWAPVIISALGETLDRASLWAARTAFVTGLLANRAAYPLWLPRLALQEWIDGRMGAWLAEHGVTIHRGTPVRRIGGDGRAAAGVVLADGMQSAADFVIAAVPWGSIAALLSDAQRATLPALQSAQRIEAGAITAVHLWFDRPLCDLPHAVLVDRTSQWMFADGPVQGMGPDGAGATAGRHYQVVISASHTLADRDPERIFQCARGDLEAVWPAARGLRLLRHRVITQPAAVFSVAPGVDQLRPRQATPLGNLFLAGDWTATGWPATMEGAVRSGRLAAEALLATLGRPQRLLTPDLPRGALARWWCGRE
jgi:squalene-associated FAD-dependent desaturase